MNTGVQNGKNLDCSWPSPVKEKLRPFSQRHFARLQIKYPFLPKSQIRYKVKTLWEKLNRKKSGKDWIVNNKKAVALPGWDQPQSNIPRLQLREKQDDFKKTNTEQLSRGDDFLMDLFSDAASEAAEVIKGTATKSDDVIEFTDLFLDDQQTIFL